MFRVFSVLYQVERDRQVSICHLNRAAARNFNKHDSKSVTTFKVSVTFAHTSHREHFQCGGHHPDVCEYILRVKLNQLKEYVKLEKKKCMYYFVINTE
jgi:hypothetical protein